MMEMFLTTLSAEIGVTLDTMIQVFSSVILALVTIFLARLHFVINRLETAQRDTEKELWKMKEDLPTNYVRNVALDNMRGEITAALTALSAEMRSGFEKLHDELKGKADVTRCMEMRGVLTDLHNEIKNKVDK